MCPQELRQGRGTAWWSTRIAALVLLLGLFPVWPRGVRADQDDGSGKICSRTWGLQGRITAINSKPGLEKSLSPRAYVERGQEIRPATVDCFLSRGDFVRPGPATVVIVELPSEQVTAADFYHPLIVGLSQDFAVADASKARELALATIGGTRSPDRAAPAAAEITLLGAIGTAPQSIDSSRPLIVRWSGGTPPFRIELSGIGSNDSWMMETSDRSQRLDLSWHPPGAGYTLTIVGANEDRLALPIRLVSAADVPVAPELEAVRDEDAHELMEAVWLLMRASLDWRLEALSRLELLATDRKNVAAQAIVSPEGARDEPIDR